MRRIFWPSAVLYILGEGPKAALPSSQVFVLDQIWTNFGPYLDLAMIHYH
jgi:hypothetical protein